MDQVKFSSSYVETQLISPAWKDKMKSWPSSVNLTYASGVNGAHFSGCRLGCLVRNQHVCNLFW